MNKQIEEMAKVIRDFAKEKEINSNSIYLLASCEDDKLKNSIHAEIAEALYNAGYRKVNEGDIVLTKEDMKKYAKDCIAGEETGLNIINGLIARVERTSKETAREILQEINQLCKEQAKRFSHLCKTKKEAKEETLRYEGVLAVKNRLDKIAEKHGVEVE